MPRRVTTARPTLRFPTVYWGAVARCGPELIDIEAAVRAYPDSPERRQVLDRLARLR